MCDIQAKGYKTSETGRADTRSVRDSYVNIDFRLKGTGSETSVDDIRLEIKK